MRVLGGNVACQRQGCTNILSFLAAILPATQGLSILDLSYQEWTVSAPELNISVPAKIPSHVQLDLLAAGVISDPYHDLNDFNHRWISDANWTYTTQVQGLISGNGSTTSSYLLFNGLDTYATIWFCDRIIATTDNQFRQYFFDITDVLQTCNSTAPRLELEFGAVPAIAAAIANQPGQRTWPDGVQNYFVFGDRQFVRKQQSDFGWDWSPALMPVGIWQDCYLVQLDAGQVHVRNSIFDIYRKGQLNNLPPNQEADWVFNASIDVLGTLPSGSTLRYRIVDLELGSQISSGSLQNVSSKDHVITGNTGLDGRAYKLWWPVGFGPQNLYNITVDVILGETTIASVTKRMGFRTIVLNQEPVSDADQAKGVAPGSYFHFEINGFPFYAKGSNFIPPDAFWPRVTREKISQLFGAAIWANQNMLRVWSSGAYLPGWIYDMADEMGLLLWSEFQFSDAMYPVDADFLANVRAEAEYQVRRLNHHPSLALWAGGNEIENLELWLVNRSAPDQLDHYKGEYETLFLRTLLPAVYENSRSISYIPSSATNGYLSLRHEDAGFPMILRYHNESSIPGIIYGDREYYNYTASIAFVPGVWPVGRFTNEYGFHSLPSAASWRAAVPDPVAASSLRLSDRTVILRNRHYPVGNLTTTNLQNPALGIVEMVIAAHMYYPVPNKTEAEAMRPGANFSAWCHTTQVFQADFVRAQTSFYRVGMGKRQRTLGSLYWMLEDVWQTVSWAGIEHEGRWKVLHYAARDALADVALALIYDPLTSTLDVNVVSDLWVPVRGNVSLAWYAWNGTLLDHVPTTTGVADADTSLWPLLLWPGARDVPFEVGPLNSTLVARINIAQLATPTALFGLWWSFLGFYPPILDTRSSVLLANLTATAVSAYPRASPTEPTRTVTHSAFFTPTPLSAAKLADPVVSVHFDAGADEFIVRADNAIAVWTWLALEEITDDGVIVTFDQNGFLLRKGEERRVKYTVVSGESPGWQSRVTVQSVWDDTLP